MEAMLQHKDKFMELSLQLDFGTRFVLIVAALFFTTCYKLFGITGILIESIPLKLVISVLLSSVLFNLFVIFVFLHIVRFKYVFPFIFLSELALNLHNKRPLEYYSWILTVFVVWSTTSLYLSRLRRQQMNYVGKIHSDCNIACPWGYSALLCRLCLKPAQVSRTTLTCRTLHCGHMFHITCVTPTLAILDVCPICKEANSFKSKCLQILFE